MINILHLYYDILNLYGENANVRCIEANLKRNNIKVKIDYKSINDKIDFSKYDIVYIGSGDEESIEICTEHLKTIKDNINKYIKNNGYLFLTGNSMYMFGNKINDNDATQIFDYDVKYLNNSKIKNASTNRIVGETLSTCEFFDKPIIGFQNRCGIVNGIKTPLFKVRNDYSNNLKNNQEGFKYKNVYATHTIGPLFIRNPYFTDYILDLVCKSKNLTYITCGDDAKIAYEKNTNYIIN